MNKTIFDADGPLYQVYLDGELLNACIMASEEQGLAVCYVSEEQPNGHIQNVVDERGDRLLVERHGEIRIVRAEATVE